jgi:hypothetical protein
LKDDDLIKKIKEKRSEYNEHYIEF